MRAIDKGILPLPPILVIEGNTLYREQGAGKSLVAEVMDSPWFSVGRKFPNLGATARPSAFAYSILLERKVGRADEGERLPLPVPALAMIPPPDAEPMPEKASAVIAELTAITERFRERGCRMLIVQLPPGAEHGGGVVLVFALAAEERDEQVAIRQLGDAGGMLVVARRHLRPEQPLEPQPVRGRGFPTERKGGDGHGETATGRHA
jgi:hypothetical protein